MMIFEKKILATGIAFLCTGYLLGQPAGAAKQATAMGHDVQIIAGWQLIDAAKIKTPGAEIATIAFKPTGWLPATVPGTVLTTLVNNRIYPEPLYGENNRPDKITDSLCRTAYWYRNSISIPQSYHGKHIWLNFAGINYSAKVWVNGKQAGIIQGAFARGIFDITNLVRVGKQAAIAVLVSPQPNPGVSHEHTIKLGMGANGGITAMDGPTFLCSIGWDWIPAIRDRNTGIWQGVSLSTSGPVLIKDPLITTDVKLPGLASADVKVSVRLENVTNESYNGVVKGVFAGINFAKKITIPAHSSKAVTFDQSAYPQLTVKNPKLWWPNGYGPQNLYQLKLDFSVNGTVSDSKDISFGIRKITYTVPDAENLTVSVNGVKIMCRGGNWGMDEAMKRIPKSRLEAQIRLHQLANYNMIRNWVGQSTSEDFYTLCDKYGMLLWDEFFQPNPGDGPNPANLSLYIANVREKIIRFRNHPSIAIWCARNEGYPPANIDSALRQLMAELEPVRLYQPSSTAGRGVHSNGPYRWRKPAEFYIFNQEEAFKTEIGSVSIPTLESIQGMMPKKDWEIINDDWAEHDLAKGAQAGNIYPQEISNRYGKVANLADFVRKAQLANYEAFRAIYEGRNAKMFAPCTGVITWMSNPAQPSFVWQIYHHDLEPNSSLFAVKKACEAVHIQFNEKDERLQVINNLPATLSHARAEVNIYNLDGTLAGRQMFRLNAPGTKTTNIGVMQWPAKLSNVHFIKLKLWNKEGQLLTDNVYWHALAAKPDDLSDLNKMPTATVTAKLVRADKNGKCILQTTLRNSGHNIALMVHLQLRGARSNQRVLPVYYSDNYITLMPGEIKKITVEASLADLKGDKPMLALDGWNLKIKDFATSNAAICLNKQAEPTYWPVTGLPFTLNPTDK
jgi:hypothetical protein